MKKGKSLIINLFGFIFCVFFMSSCGTERPEEKREEAKKEPNEISEATDDKVITEETVVIGNIEFDKVDLTVSTYRNGDPIPQAKNAEEWKKFAEKKEGCWAYPDFNQEEGQLGLVYSGYCISDKRNLAPTGWKIPSRKDWETAIAGVGDAKIAGKKFKSESGWKTPGDNATKFDATPKPFFAGGFNHDLQVIYYWSSSEPAPEYHYHFDLSGDNDEFASWYDFDGWGLYVRCVKE